MKVSIVTECVCFVVFSDEIYLLAKLEGWIFVVKSDGNVSFLPRSRF